MFRTPFLLFYPVALVGGACGVGLWIFPGPAFAARWHANIMLGLFLLPAALGFLLTNLHKFLQAGDRPARRFEILGFLFLLLVQALCAALDWRVGFQLSLFATILGVALYALSRGALGKKIAQVRVAPYLAGGMLLGLCGSGIQALAALGIDISSNLSFAARLWLNHGLFWMLLAGFGAALFPMLTLSTPRRLPRVRQAIQSSRVLRLAPVALLFISFVASIPEYFVAMLWLRSVAITIVALFFWNLWERSARRGLTTTTLKLALSVAVAAHWLMPVFPQLHSHLSHGPLMFGFALSILVVSGRNYLNHTKRIQIEPGSITLGLGYALLGIASVLRLTAHLSPGYFTQIQFAAGIWLLGLSVWTLAIARPRPG